MEEEYDPRKRFEEYLKENEGKPIDKLAEAAAKIELSEGQKIDYAVYKDEPDRKTKFKGYPEGELYKTNLSKQELEDEILNLSEAKKIIISFLEKPIIENEDFKITRETTLFDLEEKLKEGGTLISKTVSDLAKYDFDGYIALYDLPQEIEERIKKEKIILEHLDRKVA